MFGSSAQISLLLTEAQKEQSLLTVPVFDASIFQNSIIAQLTSENSKYSKDLETNTALFKEYLVQLKKLKEEFFQIEQDKAAKLTEAMLEKDLDYFADEAKRRLIMSERIREEVLQRNEKEGSTAKDDFARIKELIAALQEQSKRIQLLFEQIKLLEQSIKAKQAELKVLTESLAVDCEKILPVATAYIEKTGVTHLDGSQLDDIEKTNLAQKIILAYIDMAASNEVTTVGLDKKLQQIVLENDYRYAATPAQLGTQNHAVLFLSSNLPDDPRSLPELVKDIVEKRHEVVRLEKEIISEINEAADKRSKLSGELEKEDTLEDEFARLMESSEMLGNAPSTGNDSSDSYSPLTPRR